MYKPALLVVMSSSPLCVTAVDYITTTKLTGKTILHSRCLMKLIYT